MNIDVSSTRFRRKLCQSVAKSQYASHSYLGGTRADVDSTFHVPRSCLSGSPGYRVTAFWFWLPSTWHQVLGTKYMISSTRYQVLLGPLFKILPGPLGQNTGGTRLSKYRRFEILEIALLNISIALNQFIKILPNLFGQNTYPAQAQYV